MIDIDVKLMDGVGVGIDGVGVAGASGRVLESAAAAPTAVPDPEVRSTGRRSIRKTADKLRIVREFDACKNAGEKGAILRREGIYGSYITRWRDEIDKRALLGLSDQKRGPKPDPARKEKLRIAELEKQTQRLEKSLRKAHIIIDVQKKLSEVLGITLRPPTEEEIS